MKAVYFLVILLSGFMASAAPAVKAQNVCNGVYFAQSDGLRCAQLIGASREVCEGIRKAGRSKSACSELSGLAKNICEGTAAITMEDHECSKTDCSALTGDSYEVCVGTNYALNCDTTLTCGKLKGFAKNVCWGVLYANQQTCGDLNF